MLINLVREVWIASLLTKMVTIPDEYSDFLVIFSKDSAIELSTSSDINKHAIDLNLGKEPFYRPIYSLEPVELETL